MKKIKTLSLKQPWAELILQGKKKIEIRKWNTKFRGEFLIHASKTPDVKNMERFGFESLPLGFIVGKAKLLDVKKYENLGSFNEDKGLHLANREFGMYGFVLDNIQRIDPIPARGQLNFWEFDYANKI